MTVTRRVVRFSSLMRRWLSSPWTSLVTVGLGMRSEFAAFVKLPASTTRTNTRMASIWLKFGLAAMARIIHYWK